MTRGYGGARMISGDEDSPGATDSSESRPKASLVLESISRCRERADRLDTSF